MRNFFAFLIVLACCQPAMASEPPFAPASVTIDYVATFTIASAHTKRIDRRTVTHHDPWSRIETVIDDRYHQISFARDDRPVTVAYSPGKNGQLEIVRITAERPTRVGDEQPFKTGANDSLLGERCDVWEIARTTSRGFQNREIEANTLSCVTDDGIELWRKRFYDGRETTSMVANSLMRQAVDAREAYPPAGLLDWARWSGSAAASVDASLAPPDAVVTLSPGPNGRSPETIRIVRRHFPWTRIDSVMDDGARKITVSNARTGLQLWFEQRADGRVDKLNIHKRESGAAPAPVIERDTGRTETILGESCRWIDLMPGVADAGHTQCRSADGLPLKDARGGRGFHHVLVATELRRAPLAPADVLPPPRILAPKNWGLDDAAN